MTLVVAGIAARTAWMVSDTLITGGTIQLREREYQIKCITSQDRQALVAFSGDAHNGAMLIEHAASMTSGEAVVTTLCDLQREHAEVDIIYAFLDGDIPRLFKITDGTGQEVSATYLGDKDAFEEFQRVRHATEIDPVPKAVEKFIFGTGTPSEIPLNVQRDTLSMLRLFMQRSERDVGGWAVPYVLVREGAFMCGYAHLVSDQILDKVAPGSIVPHGTAEAGGYGLAVTQLGDLEGMVVYYRQLPGGVILSRQDTGFKTINISGTPSEFRAKALETFGRPVDIFFNDAPLGGPESITILRDEKGHPAMAIARRGQDLSFSVLNVATRFRVQTRLDLASKRN